MNPLRKTHVDVQCFLVSAAFACGFAVILATAGVAADPLPLPFLLDWKERAADGLVTNGEAVDLTEQRPFGQLHALKVVSPTKPGEAAANPVIELTAIENPPITKQNFALNGWIRHSGVEGTGYLEMWTAFADGSHYFSRTLGQIGPMKSLSGDSDWREISLPFQLSDDPNAPKPSKLIINVVLPGAGEVTLSDLAMTEADSITAAITPGAWWSDRAAGWVGGALLGVIGTAIGVLAGLGYGRRLIIPLLIAGIALGTILLERIHH